MSVQVKFWGVRGSIATPSADHMKYGGNTSCVELVLDGQIVILDAGTGVRMLGNCLLSRNIKNYLFLQSHTHWDHINGFPFFAPVYCEDVNIQIMAGHLCKCGGIEKVLSAQMCQPTFPVPFEELAANIEFKDFQSGDEFTILENTSVKTAPLVHPDGGTGYRIEHNGVVVCYVTDTEHTPGQANENILKLIEGADLVIYDSTYTDDEYPKFVGWGHSTWQEGIRLCKAAGVKKLAIFHHDPSHDDDFMDRVAADAAAEWDGAFVAREGQIVEIENSDLQTDAVKLKSAFG